MIEVAAADVPMLGNRRFWVHEGGSSSDEELVATYDALDAEHVPGTPPIGLLVIVDPTSGPAFGPEAVHATGFVHVGFADDGRQVRVRYFTDAQITLA